MKVSRGAKPSVKDLAVDRYRCQASIEVQKHQTQEMRLDRSTRCRGGVEEAFKTVFGEEKNTDMNVIMHATQPMIQTPYYLSKSSLNNILSTWIPKTYTHTHTLNNSNQFYISKIS